MAVDILIDDVIVYIMIFLNDLDKIKFPSLCERLHMFKHKVYYNELTPIYNIQKLSYYNRFSQNIKDFYFRLKRLYSYHRYSMFDIMFDAS